jgi:hypothetical protein
MRAAPSHFLSVTWASRFGHVGKLQVSLPPEFKDQVSIGPCGDASIIAAEQ